jgi:heparan-alpha-glucosaminide N-acetyltransferase
MTAIDSSTAIYARAEAAAPQVVSRIVSIDIFRGLTMAAMIFVNALAEVPGLPWWTYHAHAHEDVMTYVDMVFPFFLFIVGMSLPLSVAQRLKRNTSLPALWLHVVLRVLSLIGLGLILANAEKADPSRMGISGSLWALLGLLCAALYLNVYLPSKRYPAYSKILRGIGLVGVIVLYALFRRTTHEGQPAWIDPSYPEILGLIGFSYLAVAILYIPTRRWRWAAPAWFVLLLALCVCSTAKLVPLPDHLPLYIWPFGNGAMACIVMAGVVTSQIFLGPDLGPIRRPLPRRAMSVAAGLAIVMLIAGWICIPLGISKIRATPTWSLWSVGAAILFFIFLYWVCDVKRRTGWAFLIRPAGSNALLTYLLPDLWYFLTATFGITYLDTHLSLGWPAVIKTVVFTLVMLALASILTRAKIRLQL